MKKTILMISLVGLLTSACIASDADKSDKKSEKKQTAEKTEITMDTAKTTDSTKVTDNDSTKAKAKQVEPEKVTTELGVIYQDLVIGKGKECKIGTPLLCHYTLWGGDSTGVKGKKFDSSVDRGQPFKCTLGTGLISGWSDGMVGMKEGGTRRLIIKPELGYGASGAGGVIPPNQWLVFEIEFLQHL